MMLLLLIFDLMFVTSGKKLLIGAILIGVHTEILPVRVLDSGMRHDRSDLWTLDRMSDMHTFEDLCNSADDELFIKIRKYSNHILQGLLPPPSTASQNYSLRQRAHSLQLPERSTHLSDCNFLMRMMYKNSY